MRGQVTRPKPEEQRVIEDKWRPALMNSPTFDEMQTAYDEIHRHFKADRPAMPLYHPEPGRHDIAMARLIGQGNWVLEIGGGSGTLAILLASRGNQVTYSDISDLSVQEARERTPKHLLPRMDFQIADARDLPFPPDTFDYAVSGNLIEHLCPQDVTTHLSTVQRVLKKGGAYVFHMPSKTLRTERAVGFHLRLYGLTETRKVTEAAGFSTGWLEPKGLRFGFLPEIPASLMPLAAVYELLIAHAFLPSFLRIRLAPTLMLCAHKRR